MLNEIFSFCKQKKTEPLEEGNDELHYEDAYENLDLKHALELLPPRDRMIVELKYFEDMKLEDIAAIMEENTNTIKSRLYRSLKLPTTFETHQRAASSTPFKRWLSPAITLRKDFYYGKP